jgi:hypothetical protein
VIIISLLPELVSGALVQARTPMPFRSGLPARPKPAFQLAGGAS